jgi:predicted acetyltransferase
VHYLATAKEHRRKGYATALLKWGLEQADKDGMVVGVDASEEGFAFYRRFGFEALGEQRFDRDAVGMDCRRLPRIGDAESELLERFATSPKLG